MIQKNWLELIKPEKIEIIPGEDKLRNATLVAQPLERGFGLTLGNALRRILLSSLQGSAVTHVKIKNVLHEFSTIPGVIEDVTDIILNIKSLAIKMHSGTSKLITLNAKGPGVITASKIDIGHDIEIMNPDLAICTLDTGAEINLELNVKQGKGYIPYSQNRPEESQIGLIPVDSMFSPVRNVSYKIENARVGQVTDYDKLLMDIETNVTVSPEDAIALAARILQEQFNMFINFEEPEALPEKEEEEIKFNKNLLRKVEELELSVRSANCLKNDNIVFIGDLVRKSENEMLRTPNFGRKSLNEIKEVLTQMDLRLGMEIEDWPPENIEELARKIQDPY